MLNWFAKRAPIRVKFRVAATVQALLGLIPIGIAGAAAAGMIHTSPAVDVTLSGLTVATMCAITLYAGRLICRPYVETVVRMEALAAGDLSSPIDHTDNTDCVGRMTRAMAIFRRNTEEATKYYTLSAENIQRLITSDVEETASGGSYQMSAGSAP